MMRSRFDEQLAQLNPELIEMGALCERSSRWPPGADRGRSAGAAGARPLDSEIDRKERDIENLCLKLLLQQQPVARDLRHISAALKMITDMERIGDQAEDIAEIVLYLEASGGGHASCARWRRPPSAWSATAWTPMSATDGNAGEQVIAEDDMVDDFLRR